MRLVSVIDAAEFVGYHTTMDGPYDMMARNYVIDLDVFSIVPVGTDSLATDEMLYDKCGWRSSIPGTVYARRMFTRRLRSGN